MPHWERFKNARSGVGVYLLSLGCRPLECISISSLSMTNNDLAKHFGNIIRKLRVEAELSQESFAQLCGLHRTYVGAVERGEKNVTLETAKKIADALGMKLSSIIALLEDESDGNRS
jgi:DNA-binding XRE family transcriptional regulator